MTEQERIETLLDDSGALTEQQVTDLERRTLMLIEKKRRQVRRMRWSVAGVWGTLVVLFVIGAVTEAAVGHGAATSTIVMIVRRAGEAHLQWVRVRPFSLSWRGTR